MMNENSLRAWCALNRAQGLGSRNFSELLATFGSPEVFLGSHDSEIAEKIGNSEKWKVWKKSINDPNVDHDLNWLQADPEHRAIITLHDDRYPPLLKQISAPPPVLFVQGKADLLLMLQLAVVGSRKSTPQGEQICAELCSEIARFGLIITSGLALGIDSAAHKAAISVNCPTIAVVGTGLDRVYPAQNLQLAHQIAEIGAIVSEFPIGIGVRTHHFPQRNRVISGLSLGLLVVEASIKSGSLITARQAAEQNRDVFAVPGSILNPMSHGCHSLIKSGAKLTENANDILEELLPIVKANKNLLIDNNLLQDTAVFQTNENEHVADETISVKNKSLATSNNFAEPAGDDNPEHAEILSAMGFDPCRVDDLVARTGKTAEKISAILLLLELDGSITSLSSGRYQRLKH